MGRLERQGLDKGCKYIFIKFNLNFYGKGGKTMFTIFKFIILPAAVIWGVNKLRKKSPTFRAKTDEIVEDGKKIVDETVENLKK
ncbi:hypothetical protein A2331_06265 [Candidatus Falkowbacteria bacterium RIFOXYB2_FULL_34_18]|uniref:Uncharacterized protein n=1 Tax=Candidatus Falkowbacteria bacterium RIFOXYD2_FULL_34_120 TaxID=1798007 RepID=A0A1F5TNU8_9BACT|nr:MAG: hypothetical protein A2331_06265 [Candidatus Falkowbacteria bacterium RIFOXYB2_FULL_34_18]OGF28763.1 MAG: hypothetical protein A2500_04435 [Candidatus Falkowbacteria bacterium RIFOXYC12_FULL_34_55]OGF35709.1 MAG: hypothetical protein A2466_05125 [Candidatus Falkowbacteria bacterium RIFOXYC2_FULL_34_220]OGF38425.1 MAG: hypothetical protein A2515_00620 [Candidatus Falkowbacteria bacterium RIFOXYD12_FULL_34_57]OGF40479.1 MAG: hypothetical protein A2531_03095 [Candidatus Falkowbacteria bact